MNYVYVLVEGETEEKFVKEILNPYFQAKNIYLHPVNLGGVGIYEDIKNQLQSLLHNSAYSLVTTMIICMLVPLICQKNLK